MCVCVCFAGPGLGFWVKGAVWFRLRGLLGLGFRGLLGLGLRGPVGLGLRGLLEPVFPWRELPAAAALTESPVSQRPA